MYVSIFAVYEDKIDSRSLYDELDLYDINVTDAIKTVLVYGRVYSAFVPEIIFILLKYGDSKITISK